MFREDVSVIIHAGLKEFQNFREKLFLRVQLLNTASTCAMLAPLMAPEIFTSMEVAATVFSVSVSVCVCVCVCVCV